MSLEKIYLTLLIKKKLGRKKFLNRTLPFWGLSWTAALKPAKWAGRPVLVRWQLRRPMYDFKNSFSPAFIYILRAKYNFSRDMFCLYHFWAKIHRVIEAVKPFVGKLQHEWWDHWVSRRGKDTWRKYSFTYKAKLCLNPCDKNKCPKSSANPITVTPIWKW